MIATSPMLQFSTERLRPPPRQAAQRAAAAGAGGVAGARGRCWGERILGGTPPVLLPAATRVGESPASCAAVTWSPPNSEFDAVTEPVIAPPRQPISGEISAKMPPTPATHSPIVTTSPERFITYASASTEVIVSIVPRRRTSVSL